MQGNHAPQAYYARIRLLGHKAAGGMLEAMPSNPQSPWFAIAGWGLGVAALFPLALIAGVCFVAPVDWHTRLIVIPVLIAICALLTLLSGWCLRRRDEAKD